MADELVNEFHDALKATDAGFAYRGTVPDEVAEEAPAGPTDRAQISELMPELQSRYVAALEGENALNSALVDLPLMDDGEARATAADLAEHPGALKRFVTGWSELDPAGAAEWVGQADDAVQQEEYRSGKERAQVAQEREAAEFAKATAEVTRALRHVHSSHPHMSPELLTSLSGLAPADATPGQGVIHVAVEVERMEAQQDAYRMQVGIVDEMNRLHADRPYSYPDPPEFVPAQGRHLTADENAGNLARAIGKPSPMVAAMRTLHADVEEGWAEEDRKSKAAGGPRMRNGVRVGW